MLKARVRTLISLGGVATGTRSANRWQQKTILHDVAIASGPWIPPKSRGPFLIIPDAAVAVQCPGVC